MKFRKVKVRVRVSAWRLHVAVWATSVVLGCLAVLPRWAWKARLSEALYYGVRRAAPRLVRYRFLGLA